MPLEIRIPRLGWSMEEGYFTAWLKKEGERVKANEPLYVLESDKAQQEVESMDEGILHLPPSAPQPGDTVQVGQLIGYLLGEGETSLVQAASPATTVGQPEPVRRESANLVNAERSAVVDQIRAPANLGQSLRISPRARRVARELKLEPSAIMGTGRSGRIREKDVRAAASGASSVIPNVPS